MPCPVIDDSTGPDKHAFSSRAGNLGQPLEGYVWPLSARPGQTLTFYASGVGNNTAVIQRYRSTSGSVTAIDMASVSFTPLVQPLGVDPWANGSGWSPSFSFTIPSGWPSGIYAARFRSADGGDSYATFVVRPAASAQSNVAVLANINTWLAYNDWGGKGKYDGAALTSFLRPNTNAAPVGEGFSNHHLARGELWILTWLQDHGYNPDVHTDLDFHNGAVTGYHHLIFGTHPEYWTTTMYTRLQAFISSGGAAMSESDGNIYGSVPPGLTVLAAGSGSEMTFYQASSGGSLFSVGSITFGGSLVVDPVISQIITNVLNTY